VIFITASVEHDIFNTFFLTSGSKSLSDKLSLFGLGDALFAGKFLLFRACRLLGYSVQVVDYLDIYLFVAAEYSKARFF